MDLVIRNVRIVDGVGGPPIPSASVMVENGAIAWIGEEAARPRRHVHQEDIDGRGLTLIPGMIDCHEHFIADGGPENMDHLFKDSPDLFTIKAIANCRRALLSGVTSARDVGARFAINVEVAKATAAGAFPGPRIVAAGEWLQFPGCWPAELTRHTENVEELLLAIQEQIELGAGLIKVGVTGHSPEGDQLSTMGPAALEAAAKAAHDAGLKIAAHCIGFLGSRHAVEAGADSIEHGTYLDEETAALMAEKGTFLVPTMSTWDWTLRFGKRLGLPKETMEQSAERSESAKASFKRALDAGVRIAAGTDAGGSGARHGNIAREIELMALAGMTPQAALEAATREAAALTGIDDVTGTLEVGKQADMVLIDGDPTEEPAALRNVWAVYQGGRRIF